MNDLNLLLWQQWFLSRLQKVEQKQHLRELPVQSVKPVSRLRVSLGNLLISSGRKVKGTGAVTWAGA